MIHPSASSRKEFWLTARFSLADDDIVISDVGAHKLGHGPPIFPVSGPTLHTICERLAGDGRGLPAPSRHACIQRRIVASPVYGGS